MLAACYFWHVKSHFYQLLSSALQINEWHLLLMLVLTRI